MLDSSESESEMSLHARGAESAETMATERDQFTLNRLFRFVQFLLSSVDTLAG